MRYIQSSPQKPAKETKPAPKFGGAGGRKDYGALSDSKKIPTAGGYK